MRGAANKGDFYNISRSIRTISRENIRFASQDFGEVGFGIRGTAADNHTVNQVRSNRSKEIISNDWRSTCDGSDLLIEGKHIL